MKPSIKNGVLTFEQHGFHGGRKNVNGDGFVKMEFFFNEMSGEACISVMDKLNTADGHYAPMHLGLSELRTLRGWITQQINKVDKEESNETK